MNLTNNFLLKCSNLTKNEKVKQITPFPEKATLFSTVTLAFIGPFLRATAHSAA